MHHRITLWVSIVLLLFNVWWLCGAMGLPVPTSPALFDLNLEVAPEVVGRAMEPVTPSLHIPDLNTALARSPLPLEGGTASVVRPGDAGVRPPPNLQNVDLTAYLARPTYPNHRPSAIPSFLSRQLQPLSDPASHTDRKFQALADRFFQLHVAPPVLAERVYSFVRFSGLISHNAHLLTLEKSAQYDLVRTLQSSRRNVNTKPTRALYYLDTTSLPSRAIETPVRFEDMFLDIRELKGMEHQLDRWIQDHRMQHHQVTRNTWFNQYGTGIYGIYGIPIDGRTHRARDAVLLAMVTTPVREVVLKRMILP